jgi:hypothetical protein
VGERCSGVKGRIRVISAKVLVPGILLDLPHTKLELVVRGRVDEAGVYHTAISFDLVGDLSIVFDRGPDEKCRLLIRIDV